MIIAIRSRVSHPAPDCFEDISSLKKRQKSALCHFYAAAIQYLPFKVVIIIK
jgi:hypothetical protein